MREQDETEKYNPFLYYYIPPEIPVDDELVHAARQSAMNRNNVENMTTTSENSITDEENLPSSSKTVSASSSDEDLNIESKSDNLDNYKEEDDEDYFPLSRNTTSSLDDTIDICNLFTAKSDIVSSSFKKSDSKNEQDVQQIVPQELINQFVAMADSEQSTDTGEISHHCAFSFPAVTLTLGKENWPYLREAYQSLSTAKQWKIRRTLASSIHEIALILGEELTVSDLMPIYDGFIKDLDEVRIGVLKHLATFLKILKPTNRCQYLPRLGDFLATDNEWNWRFREELAIQLLEAVTLFNPNDVAQSIAPLSLQLLVDKVAAVRSIALELVNYLKISRVHYIFHNLSVGKIQFCLFFQVTRIISHLSVDEALVTSLILELRDTLVLNSKKWIYRQTYALLCAHLLQNSVIADSIFTKEMLPNLIGLSFDRVPNVRLAVARTLMNNVITMGRKYQISHHDITMMSVV